jgi:hypothetical protein
VRRPGPGAPALILVCALLVGCREWTERRLIGQWRTEATPERTLDLFADGTYSLRLSGKGLGFVSEILGPEKGTWRVGSRNLELRHKDSESGAERSLSWPINELHSDSAVLAGERWRRVAPDERSR